MEDNYTTKIYKVKELKNLFYNKGNKHAKEDRRKQSNYFITINTNQRVNIRSVRDRRLVERFAEVSEAFCKNIKKFIKTRDGFRTDDKREVEIVPQIEISDDRHLLHIHLTCEIIHSSNIYMDLPKIRQFFKHNCGTGKECKVFVKWYPGSKITNSDRIKNYVLKGAGGYTGDDDLEEIDF